ncbi:MAG: polymer-forming cytoskeletal protein [Candidatus Zixiibacteriota bacterium]|nr:MAG: polymer-forming cytoskeletal protein [candidate division Zixibacteria bacterium]
MAAALLTFWLLGGLLSASAATEEPRPAKKSAASEYSTSLRIEDSTGETTFIELHVTPEGAYGVDSSGEEWEYDFSQDRFIKEDSKGTKTVFTKRRKTAEPPEVLEPPDLGDLPERILTSRKISGLKLGAVTVDADERVRGPVVALGPVTVRGKVVGDVISYRKITVTSTGEITGDARAPEIVKMRGGVITGSRIETELPAVPELDIFAENSYTALTVNIIILVALLVCGLLLVAVSSGAVKRVKTCIEASFVRSFFVGLLAWFAFVPAFALLILTIIGIPVALVALPLATLLAVILGIAGLGQFVGEKMSRYLGQAGKSQLGHVILGIIVLNAFWLLMSLFLIKPGSVSQGFATLFLVLSIVIWGIGTSVGVGAAILTRFGSRDRRRPVTVQVEVGTTTPPPPPPTPPPLSSDEEK